MNRNDRCLAREAKHFTGYDEGGECCLRCGRGDHSSDECKARIPAWPALGSEMQELADEIRARNALPLAAMPRPRVVAVAAPLTVRVPDDRGPSFGKKTCSLCGDRSDLFTCAGCDAGLSELGL